ncbi:MAG: hybrid sensor histidine kinase/response regulator [Candidatus Tectomicrobia bacterium]|nr:hybrid sensor histidine kinase/response regulator [Candidatus Tectomicrobia bacterium]
MSSGLLELEKSPGAEKQMALIETVFREAHSLKGAARAVNLTEIESICQSLESKFAALKRQELDPSAELFDLFHQAVDTLGKLLFSTDGERTIEEKPKTITPTRQPESPVEEKPKIVTPTRQPESPLKDALIPPQQREEPRKQEEPKRVESKQLFIPEKPSLSETVRISTAKLDSLLLQAEEMLSAKLTASQLVSDLQNVKLMFDPWEKEWAKVYPEVRRARQLLERKENENHQGENHSHSTGLLEFLDWNHNYIKLLEDKLVTLAKSAKNDHHSLGGMVDNLLEDMKKVLMLPFSSLLEIFPKIVRDLSRDRGKDVELVMEGGDIEIDRRILEEMKDPLIHLVRNCVDHGIEEPKERERNKKLPRGMVAITISQKDSGNVELLISDDGGGIDVEKVRSTALRLGVISQDEAEKLNEQEAISLIFQSGFSTSPIITTISGRGLGLAIVREKVEKLGGTISLETNYGIGSLFRILLPLTLATFKGILVEVDEQIFVVPTANVERVARVKKDEIQTVEDKDTIRLSGRIIPLVRLADALEMPKREKNGEGLEFTLVLVLNAAKRLIAFSVDKILNEQEVLVKSLGKHLSRVRNIAGATVLGTGKVVPILNVPDLIKSAVKVTVGVLLRDTVVKRVEQKRKSILVAEDSITSRTLLKNILESAGYDVKTAVDGVDAFTAVRTEDFDLVVSDVDMPGMSGLELTAKIRADKKLSDLPVVLVTSLASRKDQERGIDVGANAYIVKSSFDQSNLLQVIQKLI